MPTTQEIIEKMKRVIESSSIEQKPIVDRYITLGLKMVINQPCYDRASMMLLWFNYHSKFDTGFDLTFERVVI